MTIFRHKNGKLYKLEMVKRRMFTEAPWLCATPLYHNTQIKKPKLEHFMAVSEK